jgi:hypothetical protein
MSPSNSIFGPWSASTSPSGANVNVPTSWTRTPDPGEVAVYRLPVTVAVMLSKSPGTPNVSDSVTSAR